MSRTEADGPSCASKSTTDTISAATRSTPWRLVDELRLGFDAGHPQGMARVGTTWWISTVDKDLRRGFLLAVDDTGALLERVPVGDDRHYHPGGMDFDGHAFWIAAADYLPDSSTIVYRVEPGGIPQRAFDVDDHIGAIARCGDDGDLVGWSWGSRRFLRWSIEGDLRATRINPGFFIDHQDCQWLDTGHLLCGGCARFGLESGPGWVGGIGLLDTESLVMKREVPFPIYSSVSHKPATHNPIWSEVRGDELVVHLLPDNGMGTIQAYLTPLVRGV